jgi:hypothetical protein
MAVRHTQVHRDTMHEAGYSTISPLSVIAGVLCAYGAFAIIAAIVGAVLSAADVNTDFQSNDWTGSGAVAALASAGVLLLAYLFGGYVAGRMARRAGLLHGVLVFIVSLVLGAIVGGIVSAVGDSSDIERNLRSIGIPTTSDQLSDVAIVGAIVSLAAVLIGSLLGGMLGERWHTKLARRVADPEVGQAADERRRVEEEEAERRERLERDDALHRDLDTQDRDGIDLRDDDDEPRYTAAEWQARQTTVR